MAVVETKQEANKQQNANDEGCAQRQRGARRHARSQADPGYLRGSSQPQTNDALGKPLRSTIGSKAAEQSNFPAQALKRISRAVAGAEQKLLCACG